MNEFKYMNLNVLKSLLLKYDKSDNDNYIGSIAEILYVQELYKKGIFKIDFSLLSKNIVSITESTPILDLDHDVLKEKIINENFEIDSNILNSQISPRHSVTKLLFKCDTKSYWDNDINYEIDDWFNNEE